jgi:uncharacterized protein (DUF736 family)
MAYDKPYEPKPNTGSLFANKEKKQPMSPDYQGTVLVDMSTLKVANGVATVKLNGWKKVSKSGLTYLSLSVDTFVPDPNYKKAAPKPQAQSVADLDDDIPF